MKIFTSWGRERGVQGEVKSLEVKGPADAQCEKIQNVKMSKIAAVATIFDMLTSLIFTNDFVLTTPLGGEGEEVEHDDRSTRHKPRPGATGRPTQKNGYKPVAKVIFR